MEIQEVGVIGAGIMGSGIAQTSAAAGYNVLVQDITEEALSSAKSTIGKNLDRLEKKGKLQPAEVNQILSRIHYTTDINEVCKNADLIVEAVFENLAVKHKLFEKLGQKCKQETILASNTSALPITEIASISDRPEKIVGIHFMNPVYLMKGVEVIRGQLTSDDTFNGTMEYIRRLGKEPIIAIDYAGFIVSRLLDVLMNEAVKMVQEGNSPGDIDKAMKLCAGHPMGPCELLDLVGAEIAMHGMEIMARDLGEQYKPHPLLKKRVLAGLLGKKTGQGFYEY